MSGLVGEPSSGAVKFNVWYLVPFVFCGWKLEPADITEAAKLTNIIGRSKASVIGADWWPPINRKMAMPTDWVVRLQRYRLYLSYPNGAPIASFIHLQVAPYANPLGTAAVQAAASFLYQVPVQFYPTSYFWVSATCCVKYSKCIVVLPLYQILGEWIRIIVVVDVSF